MGPSWWLHAIGSCRFRLCPCSLVMLSLAVIHGVLQGQRLAKSGASGQAWCAGRSSSSCLAPSRPPCPEQVWPHFDSSVCHVSTPSKVLAFLPSSQQLPESEVGVPRARFTGLGFPE